MDQIPSYTSSPLPDSNSQSPSFNLNEITHSAYFAHLFHVEESILQSDIMNLAGKVTNLQYCKELLAYQKMVQNGDGPLFPEMFPTRDSFKAWQDFELQEVRSIFEKYEPRISFDNVISEEHSMIPQSPREYYIALMALIFKRECPPDQTSFQLSLDAMFFLTRCSRLWRLDYSSTMSSLLYSAFNLANMGCEHLNLPLIVNFFSMIHIRVTHTDHLDTSLWNDVDQKESLLTSMHTETMYWLHLTCWSPYLPVRNLIFHQCYLSTTRTLQATQLSLHLRVSTEAIRTR